MGGGDGKEAAAIERGQYADGDWDGAVGPVRPLTDGEGRGKTGG